MNPHATCLLSHLLVVMAVWDGRMSTVSSKEQADTESTIIFREGDNSMNGLNIW